MLGGKRIPAMLVAGLAAASVAACGGSSSTTGSNVAAAPAAGGVDNPDPGVIHVHGLGVDPADGLLYAATHAGLFRIPADGRATRVAARFQDTMGFTVVGPHTFLGSGHPDAQMDPRLPPRLGLIRTTDAGESWSSVSLLGKADFHALHDAAGTVVGWDAGSGQLMVSADGGRTWQTRSRLALLDFAVNPSNADVMLAVTEQRLMRSADGGRHFATLHGPALTALSWPTAGHLAGIDKSGRVHLSADGGATWTARGTLPGPADALAWAGQSMYAASMEGIYVSTDRGSHWRLRYRDDVTR